MNERAKLAELHAAMRALIGGLSVKADSEFVITLEGIAYGLEKAQRLLRAIEERAAIEQAKRGEIGTRREFRVVK